MKQQGEINGGSEADSRGRDPDNVVLSVKNAAEAIEFYNQVFEASEVMRLRMPDGRIGHAEIKIGGGLIMLADEYPEMGIFSPESLGESRSPVMIHLICREHRRRLQAALEAGAVSPREPEDQFYGDRNAQVKDPSGHVWDISTHREDVSPEEMQKRLDSMMRQQSR